MNAAMIALAGAAILLAGCSGGQDKERANQPRPSAMGKEFALTSQSIALPTDETERWPAGPGVEQIDVNCRACHSPSMVLTQPPLSHDEWAKVVDKMKTTYKAPIDDKDLPMILAYLDDFSAKQLAANASRAASAGAAGPVK